MKKILLGQVAVDSGQLVVADPCYIDTQWKKDKIKDDFESVNNIGKFSFNGCAYATLHNEGENESGQLNFDNGTIGAGVAFSTGFGDGFYDVIGTYDEKNKRIKKIEIKFY